MIITFIFMVTTLVAAYIAYRQSVKASDLEQEIYEKTSIINHLQEHTKKLNAHTEEMAYNLNHTKNMIVDLRRNIDELERKTKAKPNAEKAKKAQPAAKATEPKKRKYNKRKF